MLGIEKNLRQIVTCKVTKIIHGLSVINGLIHLLQALDFITTKNFVLL